MADIVIKAEHLSKMYRLGVINNGTLWKDIQTWFALKSGKEDPHSKIGIDRYSGDEDHFWALKDLNFDIEQGDRIGIIGKNGAGKSTLLKILSRITTPTEGVINIKGKIASLLEVGTGFNGELTGRENIFLNGAILGMKKKQIERKLEEIIDFSGIEHHIDTPVKRYSSGMYVRLAFAVAAHLDSDILIADEVLAVGDSSFQKKALGKMQDLSTGQGRTVLFVSHQIPAVLTLCNKGIYLDKGMILPTNSLQDCVDLYMQDDKNDSSSYWAGSEGDDSLKMLEAYISPDGTIERNGESYEKGQKISLSLTYEILKPDANYVLSVEIFNERGTQLCASSAIDFFQRSGEKKPCSVGVHRLGLAIDTSIFATGSYYIKFDFAIHCIKRIINDTPTLAFNILDTKENIEQIAPNRHNIISPDWEWSLS